jgi:hypothetical protein
MIYNNKHVHEGATKAAKSFWHEQRSGGIRIHINTITCDSNFRKEQLYALV